MPVLSPSGQERVRTIDGNIANTRRDQFVGERGYRHDKWETSRQESLDNILGKEAVEGKLQPKPEISDPSPADEWEEHRVREERGLE